MPGYTQIVAASIRDASGNLLASGRVVFQPVNSSGRPVSAIVSSGGIITSTPVTFLVVNGAITTDLSGNTAQVADALLTTPILCYRISIVDSTGIEIQGPGYGLVQPTGTQWSLDTFPPTSTQTVTVANGSLTLVPYSGPTTGVGSAIFTDTATAAMFSLGVTDGALVLSGDTSPTYTLSVSGGSLVVTPYTGPSTGLSSALFTDTVNGDQYVLTVNGGAVVLTLSS